MKIRFTVDNENQVIIFYFKNGELIKIAKELIKRYPDTPNNERAMIGANGMTNLLSDFLKELSKKMNLPLITYTPKFIAYQKKYELPKELKQF
jgi:hypothetical protein